jgi:hypothetical protein
MLTNLEFSQQIFEKCPNIKFQENPFIWSRDVPRAWMDGRTDMTKLTVTFRNFANAHKIHEESIATNDVCIQSVHEQIKGHTFLSLLWFT